MDTTNTDKEKREEAPRLYEAGPETVMDTLLRLSRDWEAEDSCRGYRANTPADLEGRRVFLAEKDGEIVGYLFGLAGKAEERTSFMPKGASTFEVEEVYVVPSLRSRGIGAALFRYAEDTLREEASARGETVWLLLSTATKNWRAILHFYLDEMEMTFWSARLFKKLG